MAFFIDYSNVYGAAIQNTTYAESTTNSETLVETKTSDKKGNIYATAIAINERYSFKTNTNYLMAVYVVNENWLKIIIPNKDVIIVPVESFDFIDNLSISEEGITFKIEEVTYSALDTLLFKVYKSSEDDKYTIDLGTEETTLEEEIKGLSKSSTGKYTYHAQYSKTVDATDLAYCYNHFNDGKTYYDVRTNQCLRDFGKEGIKDFLRQSNIMLFIVSMIGYIVLLLYFYNRKELKLVTKKILIVDGISIMLVILLLFIPYAIL